MPATATFLAGSYRGGNQLSGPVCRSTQQAWLSAGRRREDKHKEAGPQNGCNLYEPVEISWGMSATGSLLAGSGGGYQDHEDIPLIGQLRGPHSDRCNAPTTWCCDGVLLYIMHNSVTEAFDPYQCMLQCAHYMVL